MFPYPETHFVSSLLWILTLNIPVHLATVAYNSGHWLLLVFQRSSAFSLNLALFKVTNYFLVLGLSLLQCLQATSSQGTQHPKCSIWRNQNGFSTLSRTHFLFSHHYFWHHFLFFLSCHLPIFTYPNPSYPSRSNSLLYAAVLGYFSLNYFLPLLKCLSILHHSYGLCHILPDAICVH